MLGSKIERSWNWSHLHFFYIFHFAVPIISPRNPNQTQRSPKVQWFYHYISSQNNCMFCYYERRTLFNEVIDYSLTWRYPLPIELWMSDQVVKALSLWSKGSESDSIVRPSVVKVANSACYFVSVSQRRQSWRGYPGYP